MNKKGFIDEINPGYFILALIGGGIGYFVSGYAEAGTVIQIGSGIASFIGCYLYLAMTD